MPSVLSVASEAYPLIKTGGLADVAGALPAALAREGFAARTLLPGLLLTATLTIDGFADVPPMPGTALVAAGLMLSIGVADLLDPAARRLVAGVRIGGYFMALLGLAVQLIG